MYLVYIDETGDDGMKPASSDYFILSALAVHDSAWLKSLDAIIDFRRQLKAKFGLKLREEIHARALITKPGALARIQKWQRLVVFKEALKFVATHADWRAFNVCVDKGAKTSNRNVFELAWTTLIQRIYNSVTIKKSLPAHSKGNENFLLLPDVGHDKPLRKHSRKLRRFNHVPSYFGPPQYLPITTMIDDPAHRDSAHSYFVQLTDVCAYALKQKLKPCAYFRTKGARNYFDLLKPIVVAQASSSDPWGMGVVRIAL